MREYRAIVGATDGDHATVQFRQEFSSDKLKSTDQKTLTLVKRDGAWRIREERVG